MNTNYFLNQTMGVHSLEKLQKTKFHCILDMIFNQRTLGVPYLRRKMARGRGHALWTPSTGAELQVWPRSLDDLEASSLISVFPPLLIKMVAKRIYSGEFAGNQTRSSTEPPELCPPPRGRSGAGSARPLLFAPVCDAGPPHPPRGSRHQHHTPSARTPALPNLCLPRWPPARRGRCQLAGPKHQQRGHATDPAGPRSISALILATPRPSETALVSCTSLPHR